MASNEGNASGAIISGRLMDTDGSLGSITIGGDMRGGLGDHSGLIRNSIHASSDGGIGPIMALGNVLGGSGDSSGVIHTKEDVSAISIGGHLEGSSGDASGALLVNGKLLSLKIGGGFKNGAGENAGQVFGKVALGKVAVAGDMVGDGGPEGHRMIVTYGNLAKLTVGGSLRAAVGGGNDHFMHSNTAGAIKVEGSILGTAGDRVILDIAGKGEELSALGSLKVGGDFQNADLVVSDVKNADRQVGTIQIGGDFVASRIAISTDHGKDNAMGTADDFTLNDPETIEVSRIAKIVINGTASGTEGGTDSYRIIASDIGKVKIHGAVVKLLPATSGETEIAIGKTDDLAIRCGVAIPV